MKMPERVYALVRCADGRWLALNRCYKPFGQSDTTAWVNYDVCDGTRVWLTDTHLRKIDSGVTSYRPGDRLCWLYHDATDPRLGRAHFRGYMQRLALLGIDDEEAA